MEPTPTTKGCRAEHVVNKKRAPRCERVVGLARPGLDGGGCHGGLSSERREPATDRTWIARLGEKRTPHLASPQVRGTLRVVRDTGIEPVTSSVSGKRSPAELIAPGDVTVRGGDGNRTRVQGFAGPCLSHSATPPASRDRLFERMTGFEPATPTLARLCATNCATSALAARRLFPRRPALWQP